QQRKAGHTECRAEEGEAKEVICATAFSEKRGAVSRSNLRQRLTFGIFCSQQSTLNHQFLRSEARGKTISDSNRKGGFLRTERRAGLVRCVVHDHSCRSRQH